MESFWKVATGREPPSYDFDTQHLNGKGGGIIACKGLTRSTRSMTRQNQAVEACASTSSVNSSEGFFQL